MSEPVYIVQPLDVPGLDEYESAVLNECNTQLVSRAAINRVRSRMFEGKYDARHLGIAVPPSLERVQTTLMWPAKAVEALESHINLEGFVIPDGTAEDFGIDTIWQQNRLGIEATQAHTSALKYGVTFVAVLAGGEGEPEVIIRNLSPTTSTALWDANKRRASAALTITQMQAGVPSEFILFLETTIITGTKGAEGWVLERTPHTLGRCPVAVLPFKPSVEEPFGRSRITKGVMTITERVARTLLRMEISAEFYSSPQRWLMGADSSEFQNEDGSFKSGWSVQITKLLAIGADPDSGNVPTTGQYAQATMQPHMDMVRSDAALFSGETNIPVSALGIIHDNPASDAAMQSAYMALYGEAERAQEPFGAGWVDAMQMAVAIRDGGFNDALSGLRAKWARVDAPTLAARGDFVVKQISSFPWMAQSDVALEESGYDQTTIQRLRADRQKAQVNTLVTGIAAAAKTATADPQIASLAAQRGDAI